jgi:hypothetical protein
MAEPRSRGNNRGAETFRQTTMIHMRFGTGIQPIEIPLDSRVPLVQLPRLPITVFPYHLGSPEGFRGFTPCLELMTHSEVLEPFENE